MDFSAWSPSHLIVAALAFATIIGQAIAVLVRLKASTERLEKQGELFYHALDKRIDEVNQRVSEVRSEISDVREEIGGVREEIGGVRVDMNQQIASVREEISKLNQNHIDHLTHHDS